MSMSIIDAKKLVDNGGAAEYINRFIGIVKFSAATGSPAPFEFDDALVVATVLSHLSETAEGRKLLGLPKRKNTQYKASDFGPNSNQWRIANNFIQGKTTKKQATDELATSLNRDTDLRTAARLLDDLVNTISSAQAGIEAELAASGYDPSQPESRVDALYSVFERIAGAGSLEKMISEIDPSLPLEMRQAAARKFISDQLIDPASTRNECRNS